MTDGPPDDARDRPTRAFDPRELAQSGDATWPMLAASLERLGPDGLYAMRLGVIALIRGCTSRMLDPDAKADLVEQMQRYLDWLRHMPWSK